MALVYVDFPLSNHGFPALVSAEAAHCANDQGEGRYWEMHDAIFASFDALTEMIAAEEAPVRDKLVEIGQGAGFDGTALRECLATQKYRPIVGALFRDASDSGVNVTPTLLVGQEPVQGFVPFAELEPVIERELERVQATP